jgi:peptide-methionine (S)-S-oxide reductase
MNTIETAVFGGGCFWCTEAIFKMLAGVIKVIPGYSGGEVDNPTYEQVSTGTTGHAEVIYIEYDPLVISYKTLLTVFFASHDPTTLNKQGNDVGTQYRSVIFYSSSEQKKEAEDFIKEINDSNLTGSLVVTTLEPLIKFYEAENYHHDYYTNHKTQGYCQVIINPKLEKVQHQFAELLNEVYEK